MLGWIGSALSSAASWIGSAVSGITGAVGSLLSNPAVQQAAGAAVSAAAKTLAGSESSSSTSTPATSMPPVKSFDAGGGGEVGDKGEDEGKDKTLLYIAIGGVAIIALLILLRK